MRGRSTLWLLVLGFLFFGYVVTVGEPQATSAFASVWHAIAGGPSEQSATDKAKPKAEPVKRKKLVKQRPINKNGAAKIVEIAKAYADNGSRYPYSWGGGHDELPGPSLGECNSYHGSVHPCPASTTIGLDCSGLTRLVYSKAFGQDVLGSGPARSQLPYMVRVPASYRRPGDLVFFGRDINSISHVAIWIGKGMIIEEPFTGGHARVYRLSSKEAPVFGFYRFMP